jgi:hypothetical protein
MIDHKVVSSAKIVDEYSFLSYAKDYLKFNSFG